MYQKKLNVYNVAPFLVLLIVAILAIFAPPELSFEDKAGAYNGADIAWIIVATALVFLMTPGLAFFYGGMVHRKNVISTMIKSVVATGVVTIIWVTVGYSLCFGESIGGIIGNPMTHLFMKGINSGAPWSLAPTIPLGLFALFQLMFAIITPGLVVGAVAERVKFTSTFYLLYYLAYLFTRQLRIGHGILRDFYLKWAH